MAHTLPPSALAKSVSINDIIEYPKAAPPTYGDVTLSLQSHDLDSRKRISNLQQPSLPLSQLSLDGTTTTTRFPKYSRNADALREMLNEQAKYPPTFIAHIIGTHKETTRHGDSSTTKTITDFDLRLDMTHLLIPGPDAPESLLRHGLELTSPTAKAHRGQRTKRICPSCFDDSAPTADTHIQSYVSSSRPIRSFEFYRRITFHDTAALEKVITSLISSTIYRGHAKVIFPITHSRIKVVNPCWQTEYREKKWVRWFFYLTFLWIFSWPYLWFITGRWDVVQAAFPYSCCPDCGNRKFVSKSEKAFFEEWKRSIRRAIVSKKNGWIDEAYKQATEEAQPYTGPDGSNSIPSKENAVADALVLLHSTGSVSKDVAMAGGWGADCWRN